MQIVPAQRAGDDSAPKLLALDEAALRAVSDPWERARLAAALLSDLHERAAVALEVRRDAVHELVVKRATSKSRVARFLGITPSRVGQLLASVPKPKPKPKPARPVVDEPAPLAVEAVR